jgi:hypothetical protein
VKPVCPGLLRSPLPSIAIVECLLVLREATPKSKDGHIDRKRVPELCRIKFMVFTFRIAQFQPHTGRATSANRITADARAVSMVRFLIQRNGLFLRLSNSERLLTQGTDRPTTRIQSPGASNLFPVHWHMNKVCNIHFGLVTAKSNNPFKV